MDVRAALSVDQVLLALLAVTAVLTVVLAGTALAVQAATRRAEARRLARWARWEPVLLDVLVGDRPASSLARQVGADERGDYFRLLVGYALRLEGRSRALLVEAAAPHLDTAVGWLGHARPDRRALAVHLLGLVGSASDHRRLRPLLQDASPGVAMTTARALAASGDPAFVDDVIGAVDRFETWGVPFLASVLARFGVEAGPALLDALLDPARSETTRTACAEALRRLGYVPAADAVAALAVSDPPPPVEVQAAALRLLRDVGSPGHAWAPRALADSPVEPVRLHAVSALAALSLQPEDAARIEYALADPSPWVATRAARGLIESGRVASLRVVAGADTPEAAVARQALAEAGEGVPT